MISKKEDPAHSDFITAMTTLPAAQKASICNTLKTSTNSLMYVNQMYVVKRIAYNVTQGNSIAGWSSCIWRLDYFRIDCLLLYQGQH